MCSRLLSAALAPSLALLFVGAAAAQPGPGLGNITYSEAELFEPVGFIESIEGHGNVTMVQGYLMVITSGGLSGLSIETMRQLQEQATDPVYRPTNPYRGRRRR